MHPRVTPPDSLNALGACTSITSNLCAHMLLLQRERCVTTCGYPLACKCSCEYCAMKIHESMWDVGHPDLHLPCRQFPSKSSDSKSSNPHVVEDPFRTAKRAPPCASRKRNRPWLLKRFVGFHALLAEQRGLKETHDHHDLKEKDYSKNCRF